MNVRVIVRPDGSASEELRDQWIDLELPVDLAMLALMPLEDALGGGSVDVVTHKPAGRSLGSEWPVKFEDAMAALRASGRDDAAKEWEKMKQDWPPHLTHLMFGKSECQVVETDEVLDSPSQPFPGEVLLHVGLDVGSRPTGK